MATVSKKSNNPKLAIVAIALAGLLYFGKRKLNAAKEVIGSLQAKVKNISNIRTSFPFIKADGVISLTNPTNIDFGATLSSKIVLKEIHVFSKNDVFLGKGITNISEINLPANSTINLPEITFEFNMSNALQVLGLQLRQKSILEEAFKDLKFKLFIDAFGKTLTINA